MDNTPMISTWMGVPLDELPRDELEQALIDTCKQLQAAQDRECERSVAHVRALAALGQSAEQVLARAPAFRVTDETAPIRRDGTVRAGSVIHELPDGQFGFIAVHPEEEPKIIDAAGVRPLRF